MPQPGIPSAAPVGDRCVVGLRKSEMCLILLVNGENFWKLSD